MPDTMTSCPQTVTFLIFRDITAPCLRFLRLEGSSSPEPFTTHLLQCLFRQLTP